MNNLIKHIFGFVFGSLCLVIDSVAQEQPNIIFVLADDMGYADLSCYGNPVIETPFLDSIANIGVRATNFVLASPTCSPSRAALLTGRYPSRYNIPAPLGPGSDLGLPATELTIASILKRGGYKTKMIGKWHLGDKKGFLPMEHGFDDYFGLLYSHDYRSPYVQTDTTIKLYRNDTPVTREPADSSLTTLYHQEAINYLHDQKTGEPFFLYLAYNMPHLPVFYAAHTSDYRDGNGGELGAVIAEMDAGLRTIWNALEKQGLAENTIFIFTSDNGPWSEYPNRMADDGVTQRNHAGYSGVFRGSKASTYEGGVRVPFILYWPQHVSSKVLKQVVSAVDLLPTLAQWANAPIPKALVLDGQPIGELFTTDVAKINHRPIYYEHNGSPQAVRVDDWKLRRVTEGGKRIEELFNLAEDPAERVNVIKDYPAQYKRLSVFLDGFPNVH